MSHRCCPVSACWAGLVPANVPQHLGGTLLFRNQPLTTF